MSSAGRRGGWLRLPHVLCGLLVLLYAWQLWLHASSTSATTDEPLHLLAGHRYLQCGDYAFNPEHPPLLKELAALPLRTMQVEMPEQLPCNPGFIHKAESFRLGAAFMQANGNERLLVPARTTAMLPSVLLSLLVWIAAWRMFGAWQAVGVMALFAMEPVLVAHGSLVTTDMAITMSSFLAVLVMYSCGSWGSTLRVFALGGAFGLMLASKHSAVLIIPVLVMLRLVDASAFREEAWRPARHVAKPLLELCLAGALALLILWAFYGFRYSATPGAESTVDLSQFIGVVGKPGASELTIAKLLPWIGASGLFPEAYLMGLTDIVGTSVRNTRVLGRFYQEGQWFFYPVAFSVKSSAALLLLLPVGLVALALDKTRRRQLLFLVLPPAAYLAIAMSSKFTDGIRHILQVYPYCILIAGFGLSALWVRGRVLAWVLACLLGYQAVVVARTSPDYIPFANAFWGGPARAYDALTFDSVEWGQSLKRIRNYIDRNGVKECWVAGVGDPLLFAQMHPCKRFPEGRFWRSRRGGVEAIPASIDGTLFLGVRMASPREGATYRSLLAREPAMLAGAVFVLEGHFDVPEVAGLAHAMAADDLVREQRLQEAIRTGQEAVALSGDDPRTWISYAEALLAAGDLEQAKEAGARASHALAAHPEYAFFANERLSALRRQLDGQQ